MPPTASKYERLTPLEHVLKRPEMYIGSVSSQPEAQWAFHPSASISDFTCTWQEPLSNQGLLKIFDEILVNASDNIERTTGKRAQTYIKVMYDSETHRITVRNDGAGIPVEIHPKEKMYVPEMIFGELLTGSNFGEEQDSTTAGRHGYGAKLTNIFSKSFSVVAQCAGRRFSMSWKNNKTPIGSPKIERADDAGDFTEISWITDFPRFGETKYTNDMLRIFRKRCFDLAVANPSVRVTWNSVQFPNSFANYITCFAPEESPIFVDNVKMRQSAHEFAEFGVYFADNTKARDVTCVNGVMTVQGGTHLKYFRSVLEAAVEKAGKDHVLEHPETKISKKNLLNTLTFVCMTKVVKPKFDSQSKTKLVSEFDSKVINYDVAELAAWIREAPRFEEFIQSKHTELIKQMAAGTRGRSNFLRIPKLMDAPHARNNSGIHNPCTLIVTEGDSAKALAASSLTPSMKNNFGVYPLRGKVLNVRTNYKKLKDNTELMNFFSAVGLKPGTEPRSLDELRYQRILIMTDQDPDGSHIRGLILNAMDYLWPKLSRTPGFLELFVTPLLKVTVKGSGTKKQVISFFNRVDYEKWQRQNPEVEYTSKYYKGLGTSTAAEGREYVKNLDQHILQISDFGGGMSALRNAFDQKTADWRKDWVTSVSVHNEPNTAVLKKIGSSSVRAYPLVNFVNNELVHFAAYDCYRSLPSLVDGLKISSRKTLWTMLHRKGGETKVSALAGEIIQKSNYHHGESSLLSVIVGMAQNYVGAKNIPLLEPIGQFGTRLHGGTDAAAPRYIFTKTHRLARAMFPSEDDKLLESVMEDGDAFEPKSYAPVIPMWMCNPVTGIGTGFMTSLPAWHPLDLLRVVRTRLNQSKVAAHKLLDTMPHGGVGYLGTTKMSGERKYASRGAFSIHRPRKSGTKVLLRIYELALYESVESYRKTLDHLYDEKIIEGYTDYSTGSSVDLEVVIRENTLTTLLKRKPEEKSIYAQFGLESETRCSIAAMDSEQRVKIPSSLSVAFEEYFMFRLQVYKDRRTRLLQQLKIEIKKTESLMKFTEDIRTKRLDITNRTPDGVVKFLRDHKYYVDPETDDFNYLLSRNIMALTKTNLDKLAEKKASAQKRMKKIEASSAEDLWEEDLRNFSSVFTDYEQERLEEILDEHRLRQVPPLDDQFMRMLTSKYGPPDGGTSGGGSLGGGAAGSSGKRGGGPAGGRSRVLGAVSFSALEEEEKPTHTAKPIAQQPQEDKTDRFEEGGNSSANGSGGFGGSGGLSIPASGPSLEPIMDSNPPPPQPLLPLPPRVPEVGVFGTGTTMLSEMPTSPLLAMAQWNRMKMLNFSRNAKMIAGSGSPATIAAGLMKKFLF